MQNNVFAVYYNSTNLFFIDTQIFAAVQVI